MNKKVTLDLDNYVRIATNQPYYDAIKSSKIELLWRVLCKQHFGITKRTVPIWKLQYERMISYIPHLMEIGNIDNMIVFQRIIWNCGKHLIKHMINIIPSLPPTDDVFISCLKVIGGCIPDLPIGDRLPSREMLQDMFFVLLDDDSTTSIPTNIILTDNIVTDLMMLYLDDLCKLYNYKRLVKPEYIYDTNRYSVHKQIHSFLNRLAHVLLIHFKRYPAIDTKGTLGMQLCSSIPLNSLLHYVMGTFFPYKPFNMKCHIHVYKPPTILYRPLSPNDITRFELLDFMGIRDATVNIGFWQLYVAYRRYLKYNSQSHDAMIEFIMNVIVPSGYSFHNDPIFDLMVKCNSVYVWNRCAERQLRDIVEIYDIDND